MDQVEAALRPLRRKHASAIGCSPTSLLPDLTLPSHEEQRIEASRLSDGLAKPLLEELPVHLVEEGDAGERAQGFERTEQRPIDDEDRLEWQFDHDREALQRQARPRSELVCTQNERRWCRTGSQRVAEIAAACGGVQCSLYRAAF